MPKGEEHYNWKGGIRKGGKEGYTREKCPAHPYCDDRGYVLQHRLVMEKHLGRQLLPTEVVHHINRDTNDNRIENLMVYNKGEHTTLHRIGKNHTDIAKDKIRLARLGKKRSVEDRKKMSERHKGTKHSEETKRKIGLKSKETWNRIRKNKEQELK